MKERGTELVMGTRTPLPFPPSSHSVHTCRASTQHSTDQVPHHLNRMRLLPCHAAKVKTARYCRYVEVMSTSPKNAVLRPRFP